MSLDLSHFALIEYDRNFAHRHDCSNQCRNWALLVHILLFRLNSPKRYAARYHKIGPPMPCKPSAKTQCQNLAFDSHGKIK